MGIYVAPFPNIRPTLEAISMHPPEYRGSGRGECQGSERGGASLRATPVVSSPV